MISNYGKQLDGRKEKGGLVKFIATSSENKEDEATSPEKVDMECGNKGTDDNMSNTLVVSMSTNSTKRGQQVIGSHKGSKGKKVADREISPRNSGGPKAKIRTDEVENGVTDMDIDEGAGKGKMLKLMNKDDEDQSLLTVGLAEQPHREP